MNFNNAANSYYYNQKPVQQQNVQFSSAYQGPQQRQLAPNNIMSGPQMVPLNAQMMGNMGGMPNQMLNKREPIGVAALNRMEFIGLGTTNILNGAKVCALNEVGVPNVQIDLENSIDTNAEFLTDVSSYDSLLKNIDTFESIMNVK